jgi:uncharacterized membrane protein YczE
MGGLIGGPLIGAAIVVIGGTRGIPAGLLVTAVGGLVGALIGLACAVVPGLVLAAARGFFRRHLPLARVLAAVVCGLLLDAITSLTYDDPAAFANGHREVIAGVFALGAAVAAMSARYVVTGSKCFVARCLLKLN